MKPQVAILVPRLGRYGGVEGFGWRLAEDLAEEFAVHVICLAQDGPPPAGVTVLRLGRPLPGRAGKLLWFALAAEWARRRGGFAATLGLGPSLVQDILRISGAPTRRFWELSAAAYPAGWPRRLKTLRRWLAPGNHLALLLERLQLAHSRTIVANSHLVRDILVAAFPQLKEQDIPVIYNAADLRRFRPADAQARQMARRRWDLPPTATVLGTAATNFRLKGVFPLMEALCHLPPQVHLAVAGGRSPRPALHHAQRLGIASRVHFLGRVDDMPAFYASLDLFALNTFYDACANAVLEALAMGLPTVSTRWNGSSAFLLPSATIQDPGNPHEVAHVIANCLKRPTARSDFHPPMGLQPYRDLVRHLATSQRRSIYA